ncbi:MAG: Gfo/Idh/MocA family oxidoreductase [Chloroflexi bacterium]|nr:Gfo/Idh/MocA family oxidoreductase [Chloroflexota bacterium]
MDIVRFGIIGVGGMGSGHARNMPKIEEVRLTAVADIDPTALKTATDAFDVPGFPNATELINSGLVDAVIVATPHYFHPPIAIEAMKAGLHVISEKPMGVQVSEAQKMIDTANKTGQTLAVMFNQRSTPHIQAARKLVEQGRLGELYRTLLVEGWYRSQAYYDSATWRATWKGEGGGVIMNQAPHWLDLFTWLGGLPSRVLGRTMTRQHRIEVEDEVSALLEYKNGATGYLHESVNEAPTSSRIELCGEYGKLVVEKDRIRFWEVPQGVRAYSDSSDQMWGSPEAREVEVEVEQRESGHAAIVRNVARHIMYGEPLLTPGHDCINGLQLADAIMLSADRGNRWVDVPVSTRAFNAFIARKQAESQEKKISGPVKRVTDPSHTK